MCTRTFLLLLVLLLVMATTHVNTECTYLGVVFAAGSTVPVSEPCLRCICARAGLLCQLRVCAELPDPPPSGCVAVHRRKACCPQLRCHDEPVNSNKIEARLGPDFPDFPYNETLVGNGCVEGGTRYGPGSAMHTSTRCSYCYCIAGQQRCVRPRCLLPASGCTPQFRPHACCPTSYKCRATKVSSNSSIQHTDSCVIGGVRVSEGARATAAARSPCDACYCVRGAIRCTPLRCAPALPGCTPLVPRNACCPTSYNCSGTIEVQPLLNYDKPPDVSPEYAQLRTGAPHSIATPTAHPYHHMYPHYVVAEPHYSANAAQQTSTPYYFTSTGQPDSAGVIPTSRQHVATTKHLPLELSNPESSDKYSRISFTTTKVANGEKEKKITTEAASVVLSPVYNPNLENSLPKILKYSNYVDTEFNNDDVYLDGRNNRRIDDQIETTETSTIEITTETSTTTDETTEVTTTTDTSTMESTTYETTTYNTEEITSASKPVVKLIGNNSECIDGPIEEPATSVQSETTVDATTIIVTTPTTTIMETTAAPPTTVDNLAASAETEANYLSGTSVSFKKIPVDVEAVNKKDEDYEYDYNLQPNLEIIPFVAADAVVEQGGGITPFPPLQDALRETDDPLFPYSLNLFSPPQQTEGGFVPRDPPALYGAYTDHESSVDRADVSDCAVLHHGAPAPAPPTCDRCLCLFGAVVCHPPSCNVLSEQDSSPFRDVIRTEPAPDLHELIGDLQQHHQLVPNTSEHEDPQDDDDSFYDSLYQLLGGEPMNTTTTTTTTTSGTTIKYKTTNTPWTRVTTTTPQHQPLHQPQPQLQPPPPPLPQHQPQLQPQQTASSNSLEEASTALGLLKLAGCNIYGRMYRVGKIISELSGPCLQCRCTDTGVQCSTLPC